MSITLGELAGLVAFYVGPVLLVAGFAQFLLLRTLSLPAGRMMGALSAAAVITLLLTWGLVYVVPPVVGFLGFDRFRHYEVGVLVVPALIAALTVTICVGSLARRP